MIAILYIKKAMYHLHMTDRSFLSINPKPKQHQRHGQVWLDKTDTIEKTQVSEVEKHIDVDLANVDLANVDLANVDLANVDLANAELANDDKLPVIYRHRINNVHT